MLTLLPFTHSNSFRCCSTVYHNNIDYKEESGMQNEGRTNVQNKCNNWKAIYGYLLRGLDCGVAKYSLFKFGNGPFVRCNYRRQICRQESLANWSSTSGKVCVLSYLDHRILATILSLCIVYWLFSTIFIFLLTLGIKRSTIFTWS